MKFTDTEIWGFEGAIRGMRNPLKSHEKSDSHWCDWVNEEDCKKCGIYCLGDKEHQSYIIGDNDLDLAKRLISSGAEHSKFMRMIHVQVDIQAPRCFWSEADTYKFIEKNSESTMHKLLNNNKEITLDQFEFLAEDIDIMRAIIKELEQMRKSYKYNKDIDKNHLLRRAKYILPEGFLQLRTVDTNYAELRNMYHQRMNHRLPEWNKEFCNWIESLPYAKELIIL